MAQKVSVAVLYNQVGEDEYELMRKQSKKDLDFTPVFRMDVATVQEEIRALVKGLRTAGFRAYAVNVEDDFYALYKTLVRRKPDAIFNLIEFFNDDPRQEFMVAGLYELLRIPYTGAPPFTLGLCQRKASTKHLLLANGIRTPRFKVMTRGPLLRRHGLRYPVIVKPAREDASAGIDNSSVVENLESMHKRVQYVWDEFDQPALVEEFVDGRELNVAILGNYPPKVLPIAEMMFSDLPPHLYPIVSYDAKWNPHHEAFHKTYTQCPADLPKKVEKRVKEVALRAYQLLGCRDYARVDIRLNKQHQIYVLEVNPNPDLTEGVAFMESAKKAGMSFSVTLGKIVEMALRRTPKR
jgi:D-alanine-D-alanine ligase